MDDNGRYRRPIVSYDERNEFNVEEQPDQTDNGLSVEEEWNLLSIEVPDEEDVDDDDGDSFDNTIDANLLVGAQCAFVFEVEDSFAKWRGKGETSNLRDRENSRSTYYKKRQNEADLKLKAKGTTDIRGFLYCNVSIPIHLNISIEHDLVDKQPLPFLLHYLKQDNDADDTTNGTFEEEYLKKKKSQMTYKRPK